MTRRAITFIRVALVIFGTAYGVRVVWVVLHIWGIT